VNNINDWIMKRNASEFLIQYETCELNHSDFDLVDDGLI
jgi:hypothetical protein